ncbi:ABC transporter substrate-binding protein [Phycicoccus sp. Soil802]|uniref:ABC transporter substrate-binding protein n=1 Tax=Phycicoccus sp. Soil802 TaxID=1736414 RepID=UPI0007039EA1|nr:extracellular solute-binding protein [Phycicoccus sp. Soil802]KRF22935.1 ABC transporter substrate-binding protein [Phycicoccus sp. Soil802]
MKISRSKFAATVVAATAVVSLAACGGGGDAASSGKTTITLLTDNAETTVKPAKAIAEAFEKANPTITVKLESRPGGADGDNLVKTKLSTGDMADVFWYNSGSLLQALSPEKNLVDLTGDAALKDTDPAFLPTVTQNGKVYGAPVGTVMGGGILYNKEVYSKLGLSVPKTWAEFESNSDKIKAAGLTAVVGSFKDTWTSQLFVLGDFHNVASANPSFAADYTANKVKYATDPTAVKGFEKTAEAKARGWLNKSAGSTTFDQGMKLLASGKAGQYPLLTFPVGTLSKADAAKIGFFGIPGDDASKNGATIWPGNGQYIPKTSKNIDAAKKFIAFVASPAGSEVYSSAAPPTGPYMVTGSKVPADAPPVAQDLQAYIDAKATTPALEFLSPVKGPSLEQITVAVETGQTSGKDGAAQYDADVTKQAKQLGLPGW